MPWRNAKNNVLPTSAPAAAWPLPPPPPPPSLSHPAAMSHRNVALNVSVAAAGTQAPTRESSMVIFGMVFGNVWRNTRLVCTNECWMRTEGTIVSTTGGCSVSIMFRTTNEFRSVTTWPPSSGSGSSSVLRLPRLCLRRYPCRATLHGFKMSSCVRQLKRCNASKKISGF